LGKNIDVFVGVLHPVDQLTTVIQCHKNNTIISRARKTIEFKIAEHHNKSMIYKTEYKKKS